MYGAKLLSPLEPLASSLPLGMCDEAALRYAMLAGFRGETMSVAHSLFRYSAMRLGIVYRLYYIARTVPYGPDKSKAPFYRGSLYFILAYYSCTSPYTLIFQYGGSFRSASAFAIRSMPAAGTPCTFRAAAMAGSTFRV